MVDYLLIVVAVYLIFQSSTIYSNGFLYRFVFKFIPMILAVVCLIIAVISLNPFGILN